MDGLETLTVERDGGIATVTFDDPSRRNSLRLETTGELLEVATELAEDDDVRCIVLTHAGDYFGTGADLSELSSDDPDPAYIRRLAGELHDAIAQFHQSGVPIVGGIDGVAAGAGFSLALLPHILVLSEDARLQFAYPRVGLTGDGGSTYFLPRLVGLRTAYEIALLDEPLSADRAVELGLATDVVPTDEFETRLFDLAERLATGPTNALGESARLLFESFDRGLAGQLAEETDAIAGAMQTEDHRRGLAAFFSDKEPEFEGR